MKRLPINILTALSLLLALAAGAAWARSYYALERRGRMRGRPDGPAIRVSYWQVGQTRGVAWLYLARYSFTPRDEQQRRLLEQEVKRTQFELTQSEPAREF